jgi:anti-anti-sigma factor
MKLNVLTNDNDLTRIQNEGSITHLDFSAGNDPLVNLLGPSCYGRKVLLSLEKTPYIDSAGVGWMVMCHKRFREEGGKLVLQSIPPAVDQMLRLLGLRTFFCGE